MPLQSKRIDLEKFVDLTNKIVVNEEVDYGSVTVILGQHPVAGAIALVSGPESSSVFVIAGNLAAIDH